MSLGKHIKDHIALKIPVLSDAARANSVVLLGDSRVAQCGSAVTPTSITAVGTTITINHTGHKMSIGQTIVVGADQTEYAGIQTVSGITDTNNFTYTVSTAPSVSPATGIAYTRTDSNGDKGFFTWANALMGQRFNVLANLGVSGHTVAEVADRVDQVLAYKPKYCVVMAGFNSISASVSSSAIKADLKTIYDTLIANGIIVIALTDTPLNSSYATYSAAKQQVLLDVNAYIRDYCKTNQGAILIDAYRVTVDPLSATGQPASGMSNTDFVHLTPQAARAIGAEFNTVLGGIVPYSDSLVSSLIDNYDFDSSNVNIIINGMMQTGAGGTLVSGATGTVAEGWSLSKGNIAGGGSVVGTSQVARTDGYGYDQQIVIVSTANGERADFYTTASFHARMTVDAKIYFECELDCSSLTNFEGVWMYLNLTIDGNVVQLSPILPDQTQTYDNSDMTLILRSREIPLPAGSVMTSSSGWLKFYFSGAGGGTFKVGRCAVKNNL